MTAFDDLRLLRTFMRIAESGSITAAARALNLPQPTVSRQLRQLEDIAGVTLVRRDTHALSVTHAGERLLKDATELLNLANAASDRLQHRSGLSAQGHLRLLAVVDSGQWVASRLLAAFRKIHPEITAELHLINRPSKFIQEGFDCGILVGPVTDESVAVRKIGQVRRVLVASPKLLEEKGDPRKPMDLQTLPWMGVLQPHFYSRDQVILVQGEKKETIRLSPVLVMDSVTALREAAIAGAGVTLQPEWLVGEALQSGELAQVLPEWKVTPVDVSIVFPTGRLSTALRLFVDYAVSELPKLFKTMTHSLFDTDRRDSVP
ncbi:MAG: LysR family transcriptional regulator [Verrucomicrobiales bacterium]